MSDVERVFLGLGSNLGDRRSNLRSAVRQLFELVAVSPVYETEPVLADIERQAGAQPDVADIQQAHGPYLNLVVELATCRSAREVFETCQKIELDHGRDSKGLGLPRTLDIDLLVFGKQEISEEDLVVPHPRMCQRNFVMTPLLDLAPDLAEWCATRGYKSSELVGLVRKVSAL